MEAFPFTYEEWQGVSEASRAVVNAHFARDTVLHTSLLVEFHNVLCELRGKHGEHPLLLETQADFTMEPSERIPLYAKAAHLAIENGLLSYTIRLSLASVLLEDMDDADRALQELLACRDEVTAHADKWEQREWRELLKACEERMRRCT